MASRHIRAFISSRMQELGAEREAIKTSLGEMQIDTFVFEKDAGARPQSIQLTYLQEVDDADLYVGVFWKGYGAGTIEEFEEATLLGMDCFLYEKREDIEGSRDSELQAFLDQVGEPESGLTIGRFSTPDELSVQIKKDVERWRAENHGARQAPDTPIYYGVPARPLPEFVGRGPEILRIVRCLRSGEDVAVEGLSGAGKTTLAVALAHHPGIRRRFKHGVLWASNGPNADVSSALGSWAAALQEAGFLSKDISQLPTLPQRSQALRDAIGERRLLLVIDDVWEIDAARSLRCGGIHCAHLLTTRSKIIAREFSGPERAETLTPLGDEDAFELMQHLAPETCRSAPTAVRNLLRAVGGLPLAVRLMAGHLAASTGAFPGMFPELTEEALTELSDSRQRLQLAEQRLGMLSGKKVSLQDTIALSLEGLPESATGAFYKLGAFAPKPERFSREAAEAVTEGGGRNLALLASRNLLEIDEQSLRISLHPIVVDVARTQCDEAAVTRHRMYYLSLVNGNITDWRRIEDAYGQIRWAWRHAPDDGVLFRFVGLLGAFQTQRGLFSEQLVWGERALAAAERGSLQPAGLAQLFKAQALTIIGQAYKGIGYLEKALHCYGEALTIWQAVQDQGDARVVEQIRWKQIESLTEIGLLLADRGQPDLGLQNLHKALTLAEAGNDPGNQASSLLTIGQVLQQQMRYAEAVEYTLRALQLFRKVGDRYSEAHALEVLSRIYRRQEQLAPALEHIRQALSILDENKHRDEQIEARVGLARLGLAIVYREQGRLEDALATAQEALRISTETGDHDLRVSSLNILGNIHCKLKQPEQAAGFFRQRLSLEKQQGNRFAIAAALAQIGWFHRELGEFDKALETYRQVIAICDELKPEGQSAKADALSWMGLIHSELGQVALELECLHKQLEIWQDLNNPGKQAKTLQSIGRVHLELAQWQQGLDSYQQALAIYRELDDAGGKANALVSIASSYERSAQRLPKRDPQRQTLLRQAIAAYEEAITNAPSEPLNYSRLARAWELLEEAGSMLENLRHAASAQQHAVQLAPQNMDFSQKLHILEQKQKHVRRFGERVLRKTPVVKRILIQVSRNREDPEDSLFEKELRDEAAVLRRICSGQMGVQLPEVRFQWSLPNVPLGSFLILIDEVPTLSGTLPLDCRLYPGPLEDLQGISGEQTVNPQNLKPAVWVSRRNWAELESAGKTLWRSAQYILRTLDSAIRRQLSDFTGHQETMDLLVASLPETAERMCKRPVELSTLVMILRNLLDESVPIVAFKKIVETFELARKAGAARLAVLQAIRCIPEVRVDLPGNDSRSTFYRLGALFEEMVFNNIRTVNGISYLYLEPAVTQEMLRLLREKIQSNPHPYAAVVVDNPAVRRFVRKLIELEYPYLPALARQELLAGLDANIVDVIELEI